jgi:UDP-glucose 4-epimerase
MSKKTVLVTGGAGFIGSHTVDFLRREGYFVRVLDDLSSGNLSVIAPHISSGEVEFVKGDIRDTVAVKRSLDGVNTVVHLAALISVPYSVEHPDITFDVNLAGTMNLLRNSALARVDKFVFASSCAVYGEPGALPVNENSKINPISPYAESKALGERYCMGFSDRELVNTVILRFFNVYGSGQVLNEYSGVISRYIEQIQKGAPLVIYGDGSQTRDFVNVEDVASAIVSCVKNTNLCRGVFNIGSGEPTSIAMLAQTILELAQKNLPINNMHSRQGDIKHSYADITHAKASWGYMPSVTLKEGMRRLLQEKLVVGTN